MALDIKDPEVHHLAKAMSLATGESMTRAVKEALRERFARLERQKGKASVEDMSAIAGRLAAFVKAPYVAHAELLYDENGLPR